jgi:salicylate hydroxylase
MASDAGKDEDVEIAIVGGGIVGLVLALGLLRRRVKVKVFEQAHVFREIGAGIGFNTPSKGCMEMIDPAIIAALRASGSVALSAANKENPHDYLRWTDGYNQRNSEDPLSQKLYCQADAGYKGIEGVRRDQFVQELANILPAGIVEFNKRLFGINDVPNTERVELLFEDGSIFTADAGESRFRRALCDVVLTLISYWVRWYQV